MVDAVLTSRMIEINSKKEKKIQRYREIYSLFLFIGVAGVKLINLLFNLRSIIVGV